MDFFPKSPARSVRRGYLLSLASTLNCCNHSLSFSNKSNFIFCAVYLRKNLFAHFLFYVPVELPYQVNVIWHNDKAVHLYPVLLHKKAQAVNDNIFVLVLFQQGLPFKYGGSKKLGVILGKQ